MDRPRRAQSRLVPCIVALLSCFCGAPPPAWAGEGPESADLGPPAEASPEAGWQLLERADTPGEAYELWFRLPAGSAWRAFRLIGDVDVEPAVAVEAAMDVAADESRAARGETRRLLERGADVIVSYSRVDLPLAADRDVTTRLEREYDAERGEYRMIWREANEEGPPPDQGVVRMQRARGHWTFQPLAGGRTRVVFESHAELGGAIPAWLINPFMAGIIKSNLVDLRAAIAERDD